MSRDSDLLIVRHRDGHLWIVERCGSAARWGQQREAIAMTRAEWDAMLNERIRGFLVFEPAPKGIAMARPLREIVEHARRILDETPSYLEVDGVRIEKPYPHAHLPVADVRRLLAVVEAAEAYVEGFDGYYERAGDQTRDVLRHVDPIGLRRVVRDAGEERPT